MLVNIQDDMIELQRCGLLDKLLKDKTTKANILWGTDAYIERGDAYGKGREIFPSLILFPNMGVIKTRARRDFEQQLDRTKFHGEVSTPLWICNQMIDEIDCDWFGVTSLPNEAWHHIEALFQENQKSWKKYIDNKRLEITCGEAPYLVQRYDISTGECLPVAERLGMLDRKLHVVSHFTETKEDWQHWAFRAYEATYGYEYQGDNLLIARVNLLKTFEEYYFAKWQEKPDISMMGHLVNKIAWNLWQMDGLTDAIPCDVESLEGPSLFDFEHAKIENQPLCRIFDWRDKVKSIVVNEMKGWRIGMKFDYVIGNPPYQEDTKDTSDKPIYHLFMQSVYPIARKIELITPGRFLFNAGKTPTDWNRKMLNDEHLRVLYYEPDCRKVFANTDFKGGVVITFYDNDKRFSPIVTFARYPELNDIKYKVVSQTKNSLKEIIHAPESYKFTPLLYKDHPEIKEMTTINNKGKEVPLISKGHDFDLTTNILDKLYEIVFFDEPKNVNDIKICGRRNNKRVCLFINKHYIANDPNLNKYKVLFPKATGSGKFGEMMSESFVGEKGVGHTQTFLSIGNFDTIEEANNVQKYIKSKFVRSLLYILKVTQDNKRRVWEYVPLQDFTDKSDINWNQSIAEIDQQLYRKYGLTEEEISFIEKNVKEMK